MANNVTNVLKAKGDPAAVRRFFNSIGGGLDEDGNPMLIDFERITPMPPSLDIECDFRLIKALAFYALGKRGYGYSEYGDYALMALGKYSKAVYAEMDNISPAMLRSETGFELAKLGGQYFNNIRNHGAPTWYEWRVENWGARSTAYSQRRTADDTLVFDTAWAGVPALMLKLSAQYPDVGLSYMFAGDDLGHDVGEFEFENGAALYEHTPENGSDEAWRIMADILEPPDKEFDDELDEGEDMGDERDDDEAEGEA